MKLLANGRFLLRPPSGVDRVALELFRALKELSAELSSFELNWAVPATRKAGAAEDHGSGMDIGTDGRGLLHGQLWEQFELPRHAADAWLLNLCNMGPLLRRRQALMIHDAQVYLSPESYSMAFRLWYRFMLPKLARRSELLLTVSEYSKQALQECGVFPLGKAHVIYNGVDHMDRIVSDASILTRYQLKPGGYLLAVGSEAKHKNIQRLFSVMQRMPDSAPPLVIVGGGALQMMAGAELLRTGKIIFTGRISDGALKALYEHAMVFLFPSTTEGFGLPPLEAMRCGCPVIASNGGAIPEVCGDAALYADPAQSDEWMVAISTLMSDEPVRGRLRAAGLSRAADFNWRSSALKLLGILRSMSKSIVL